MPNADKVEALVKQLKERQAAADLANAAQAEANNKATAAAHHAVEANQQLADTKKALATALDL